MFSLEGMAAEKELSEMLNYHFDKLDEYRKNKDEIYDIISKLYDKLAVRRWGTNIRVFTLFFKPFNVPYDPENGFLVKRLQRHYFARTRLTSLFEKPEEVLDIHKRIILSEYAPFFMMLTFDLDTPEEYFNSFDPVKRLCEIYGSNYGKLKRFLKESEATLVVSCLNDYINNVEKWDRISISLVKGASPTRSTTDGVTVVSSKKQPGTEPYKGSLNCMYDNLCLYFRPKNTVLLIPPIDVPTTKKRLEFKIDYHRGLKLEQDYAGRRFTLHPSFREPYIRSIHS
jgi:hypothetical protein